MTTQRQLTNAMEDLGRTQGRKLMQLMDSTKKLAKLKLKPVWPRSLKERDVVAIRDEFGNIIGYMKADAYDQMMRHGVAKKRTMSPQALANLKEAMRHG